MSGPFHPAALAAFERTLERRQRLEPAIVVDGAVDAARYAAASPRLVWLLREPNVSAAWDTGGDRRDLRRFYRERLFGYPRWAATGAGIVRTSHVLLRGDEPALWEPGGAKRFADVLRDVAVVNVNKRGGGASHRPARLRAAAEEVAGVLAAQLTALAPDVLLLAGTADLLPPPFWRAWAGLPAEPDLPATIGPTAVVPLPHPAQTNVTHRAYADRAAAGLRQPPRARRGGPGTRPRGPVPKPPPRSTPVPREPTSTPGPRVRHSRGSPPHAPRPHAAPAPPE